jgi:predicted ATP-binding protein involved in virulence
MIKSLRAVGLNRFSPLVVSFHEDINIITGKNGSGNTTVLKLLWYAISGNLERIIAEIHFKSFELETDKLFISMVRDTTQKPTIMRVTYQIGNGEKKEIKKPSTVACNGKNSWS